MVHEQQENPQRYHEGGIKVNGDIIGNKIENWLWKLWENFICAFVYRFSITFSINNIYMKTEASYMVWICLISTEAGWLIGKLCSVVIALITPYMELRRVASPIAVFVVCPCAQQPEQGHTALAFIVRYSMLLHCHCKYLHNSVQRHRNT